MDGFRDGTGLSHLELLVLSLAHGAALPLSTAAEAAASASRELAALIRSAIEVMTVLLCAVCERGGRRGARMCVCGCVYVCVCALMCVFYG